jgi:hypothetical protein
MQKKRLMSQNDDYKTDRDKLFAEQRAIKDSIRGPSNLQVCLQLPFGASLQWGRCLTAAMISPAGSFASQGAFG